MDELTQVMNTDFSQTFLDIVVILVAFVFVVTLAEKVSVIIGKPFKWIKKNDNDHQVLTDAVATIKLMQETHAADKKEVKKEISDLEKTLSVFMEEMREVIAETQTTIQQYGENRAKDRQISIEREKRLNNRIDSMLTSNESRDSIISEIGTNVSHLTELIVNREIEDLRWTILDFTTSLSEGKKYNRESFDQVLRLYTRYEKILEENGMENGLIEESVKFIQEKYHEKLKEGFN